MDWVAGLYAIYGLDGVILNIEGRMQMMYNISKIHIHIKHKFVKECTCVHVYHHFALMPKHFNILFINHNIVLFHPLYKKLQNMEYKFGCMISLKHKQLCLQK